MLIKRNLYFLLGLILSLAVLWPLAKPGYFSHHDDVQVIRLYEMHQCFVDKQIPCRWVPDLGLGYGYPLFNYYGPLPYYVGEVFYWLTNNYLTSAKLMFAFSFLLAYVGMYLLGDLLWGRRGGMISGILYSLAPYHAANLFVRGAMGELWGMACLPFIFYFLLKLWQNKGKRNIFGLALSYTLLILSHNITAMLFLPLVLLFALILFWPKKDLNFILHLLIGFILAVLLSAFYWLPAIAESKYVHLESMTVGYFSYTEHFKGFKKLLSLGWDWRPSVREYPGSEVDANWFTVGWVHLGVLVVSMLGFVVSKKARKSKYFSLALCSILAVLVCLVMIHPRSIFIWNSLAPVFKYIQFPWRFLIFVAFFISLVSGALLKLFDKRGRSVLFLVVVVSALLFNWRYFKPEKFLEVSEKDYLQGELWDKQVRRSIFDYTPIYAQLPPPGEAPDLPEVLEGEAKFLDYSKKSFYQTGRVVSAQGALLRLPLFDFPGMVVRVNGQRVAHFNNDCRNQPYCLGLISFKIPSGEHIIEVRLTNTTVRKIGNGLSLVGIVVVMVLAFNKKRSWV